MKKLFTALAVASLVGVVAQPAFAHGSMKPRHGGQVVMTGETLFELTTAPAGVALYVLEEDEPVVASEMSAKMTITTGTAKKEVALAPAGGNKFEAKGVKIAKGSKVSVMVINKGTQARSGAVFSIK